MKNYLKIQNNGVLDTRLISLMGGTTKAGDVYKIGHFGTGLKYTVAYLLRNKIDFFIVADGKPITMTTEKEIIGESVFDVLHIDGERTSVTIQMGRDWEPWMIIREIYSNALDEGGAEYGIEELNDDPIPIDTVTLEQYKGKTAFFIEAVPDILNIYNSWDNYFQVDKKAFYETENMKIYPQDGPLRVYKQGILIHEDEKDSLFNYDVRNANINELRQYQGWLERDIIECIYKIKDARVIEYFMQNLDQDKHYEARCDYNYNFYDLQFPDEWKEAIGGAKIIHQKAKEQLEARGISMDDTHVVVPEKLYRGLSKQFEGIGALRVSQAVNDFFEVYSDKLQDKIAKSIEILENAGYFMNPELKILCGVFGDKRVLGKVDLDSKTIYLSEKLEDMDLFEMCTTLVEENEHFRTGHDDYTLEFQKHFINLYVNSIIEQKSVKLL